MNSEIQLAASGGDNSIATLSVATSVASYDDMFDKLLDVVGEDTLIKSLNFVRSGTNTLPKIEESIIKSLNGNQHEFDDLMNDIVTNGGVNVETFDRHMNGVIPNKAQKMIDRHLLMNGYAYQKGFGYEVTEELICDNDTMATSKVTILDDQRTIRATFDRFATKRKKNQEAAKEDEESRFGYEVRPKTTVKSIIDDIEAMITNYQNLKRGSGKGKGEFYKIEEEANSYKNKASHDTATKYKTKNVSKGKRSNGQAKKDNKNKKNAVRTMFRRSTKGVF